MKTDRNELALLARIRPWREFRQQLPHVFPTEASLRWFIRQHERELVATGALLKLTRGNFVDPDAFHAVAINLLRQVGMQGAQQ